MRSNPNHRIVQVDGPKCKFCNVMCKVEYIECCRDAQSCYKLSNICSQSACLSLSHKCQYETERSTSVLIVPIHLIISCQFFFVLFFLFLFLFPCLVQCSNSSLLWLSSLVSFLYFLSILLIFFLRFV